MLPARRHSSPAMLNSPRTMTCDRPSPFDRHPPPAADEGERPRAADTRGRAISRATSGLRPVLSRHLLSLAYCVRLHGTAPLLLMASERRHRGADRADQQHLATANGEPIPDHTLSLRRTCWCWTRAPCSSTRSCVRNFGDEPDATGRARTRHNVRKHVRPARRARRQAGTDARAGMGRDRAALLVEGADDRLRTLLVDSRYADRGRPGDDRKERRAFRAAARSQRARIWSSPAGWTSGAVGRARPPRPARRAARTHAPSEGAASGGAARRLRAVRDAERGVRRVVARSLSDVALLQVRRGEAPVHGGRDAVVRRPVRPRQPAADHPVPGLQPRSRRAHDEGACHWQGTKDDDAPAKSRARSSTSCASANWPICTRCRRRRATPRWIPRSCS